MEFTFSKHQHLLLHQTKHQDETFCCTRLFLCSWTLPVVSWKGGSPEQPWGQMWAPTAISQHSANSPSTLPVTSADLPWAHWDSLVAAFTKLTFTNLYILNLLSVSSYKEKLQCRIWSVHCFDAVLGLLHSLWNNFGWSDQEDEWTFCFLWITSLYWTKKHQTEQDCFLLWQYYQRLAAWAEAELQQQKLYLYIFQNYALVT